MSRATERQHAQYFLDQLEHHLRDTLEQFGSAVIAQAEACRDELRRAVFDTCQRVGQSLIVAGHRARPTLRFVAEA